MLEGSQIQLDGPQMRYSFDGAFWLNVGHWPDADALAHMGMSGEQVERIRSHFTSSGRIR